MIEGMKIRIDSEELQKHLEERATFHKAKADWYQQQRDALLAGGERAQGVTNDPVSSLEASARQHAERAGFFSFLADHVVLDEMYQLPESDLTRLELVSRYL